MRGRVYASAAEELRALLGAAAANARWILVDASDLESIDAIAMQGVVETVKRLRTRDGGVAFYGVSAGVRRFFELIGLDRLVSVSPSREDALRIAA